MDIKELLERKNAEARFLKIKDIAEFRRGSFPQPYGYDEWYDGEGAMPFVQVADVRDNLRLFATTKRKISKLAQPKSVFVPKGTVIVTLQGTIGKVAITDYDAYVDRTLAIFTDFKIDINKKYFAYILRHKFGIEKENARGCIIKTITKEEFKEFELAIPSLEVQKEIVTILEKVEEAKIILNDSIPRALVLSEQSFCGAFEELFKFEDIKNINDIKEISIDSLFNLKKGYTPSKKNEAFWTDGTVPWFRMEDLRANGRMLDRSIQLVNKAAVKEGKLIPANSLIMSTSATIGEHALIKVPFITNQNFTCFTLKDEYKDSIDIMYLYYFFFEFGDWCKYNATKGGILYAINLPVLKQFKIPVPYFGNKEKSLAKQREIIDILKKSEKTYLILREALCNLYIDKEIAFKTIFGMFFASSDDESILFSI